MGVDQLVSIEPVTSARVDHTDVIAQLSGETPMKRCVNYARASLDMTGERSSVKRQHTANSGLILARGWTEVARKEDNSRSGYTGKDRIGWNEVLDMMRSRQVDVVVAWHLDRITRNFDDLNTLITVAEEFDVGLATATGDFDLTTDTGRMVARILAAVARAEVERKAARQRLANKDRADRGDIFAGGPRPFGYRFVRETEDPERPDSRNAKGRWIVVEDESLLIKTAAQDVLGGASLREIARQWSELGYESPLRAGRIEKGCSEEDVAGWSPIGVKGILVSPRYAGLVTYKSEIVGQGNWSAILDEPTHRQLRKKLTDPARLNRTGAGGRTPQNLLTGIAVCGVCGKPVGTDTSGGRKMYACKPSKHVCPVRAEVDRHVEEAIVGFLREPSKVAAIMALGGNEAEAALAEIARLDGEMEECAAAKVRGELSLVQYAKLTGAIEEARKAAERVLEKTDRGSVVEGLSVGTAKVAEQWERINLHRKRSIIDRFLTIELMPVNRTEVGQQFRTWDPDLHVRIELKRSDD